MQLLATVQTMTAETGPARPRLEVVADADADAGAGAGPGPGPGPDDPDGELVEAWRGGQSAAFAEIVRRHQRGLFALARRYLRDDDEAQDIVQLTFVRAFKALGEFRGGSQLRTWLYRIAVNGALNRLRDGRTRRAEPLDDALPAVEREAAARAQAKEPEPLRGVLGAEAGARVRAAVARLPEKQRLVLELRVYQDLSFKEVAVVAACSENAAKVNFHHAVKRLKQWLGGVVVVDADGEAS